MITDLEIFIELVDKLQSTTGRIEKENYLLEYSGQDPVKQILQFIYDPFILSGISKKKLQKCDTLPILSTDELLNNCGIYDGDLLALLDYLKTHNSGRDYDLQVVRSFMYYFVPDACERDYLGQIITKELKTGVQPATLNKVFGKGFVKSFDVMLAQKYFDDPDKLVPDGVEFILTTKLDGIRCVCIKRNQEDIKFFSRQGQPIEYLNDIIKEVNQLPDGYVYDGELVLNNINNLESKDLYRATVKVVNSDSQDKKNVIFNIFDMLPVEDFENGISTISAYVRKQSLNKALSQLSGVWVKEVEMLYIGKDKSFITYWLDKITDDGGEGIMINLSNGPYTCKRSKDLLKVKKMKTCDIKVVGYEEGTGQNIGRLGALKCIFIGPDGNEYLVKVGSGYTEEERIDLWKIKDDLIGTIIETQYFEISSNEQGNYSLRFPVFKGRRFDKTEISMY